MRRTFATSAMVCAVVIALSSWSIAQATRGAATTTPASAPAAALGAPPEPRSVTLDAAQPAQLKVKRAKTGHLLVAPQIDGKDAGWFIFDTGAGMSCVDKTVVARLNLPDAGEVSARGSGGVEAARFRKVRSLALGPVLVKDSAVVELDLSKIALAMGEQIDGVIGYECFLAGAYEVDLVTPSITVHDRATYKLPDGEQWHGMSLLGRRPCIPGTIEGHEGGVFLVDLGANDALVVNAPTVQKLKLLDGRETRPATFGGVGGMRAARRGAVKQLTICGHRIDDVATTFSQADKGALADDDLQGTLGVGVLKQFRCVFNYKDQQVALLPRK